ncbi:bifunctional diaminohydroxyphosphoribosylaminopyrimidine deaminase/5-amino-6-(5-phosphoribosylamino)uracil reductase RibD [Stenotrophomonas sp. Betaine-02u-21]|uniref:bifunctional diaminohydroxyphosphoribosylaminopyrimidine deaminase/5-amino-6-(5-phosphoribosylamino)uracil reductase RibD n=1 Tax=unclassified Stenotrophomonas TaxID=196198 RepID=UPI000C3356CD|nr:MULTISPECIES: bifunctional diaminohydroxyphosphoribosylaminopyrimidine deaminase/5-amino-6-(5-phosphoribosylamino)uracil reductase RibD [unclassified Stenotrophomonas]PKH70156.1 bifunctional diaminohydroxyphosphoribosylaminopyrimidine deaminase/5-amino-6-(5-phosphoribosylamino)uracil reductase RibD [Stenotrophomonas sp. Betaine-02u-23]PKH73692.1 bifunctional diaminohydroxyphosphoribosylaminopyrimidine deaminase/5-amino-6-(5-phosphoribosylamino)uracil reductase RibD [Stenotrophomonas sp. Betain
MSAFSALDHLHMASALRLAERAAYTTRPNPMVGCVIAHGEQVVGHGWHQRAGGPHAEVFALREAGEQARGATAYVTLEPCAHFGRTPPCALALIEAGVSRVVAALRDPFPQVDGGGFDLLRAAGIEVHEGLMAMQARELNRGFLSRVERGRPWVRVKLAASLDGRTAMADGSSKWITGPAAREDVQHWRARAGAILTGADTVLADDPMLTVRLPGVDVQPPLRVVLDARLRSLECTRVREGGAPTLYLHDPAITAPDAADAQFASVPSVGGRLDLGAVLALLAAQGVNEVHTEAGATLAGALMSGGWIDELLLYQAPTLLGEQGLPLLSGLGIQAMTQQLRMQVIEQTRVGEDQRVLLRPQSR